MTTLESVRQELERAPEPLLREVLDFVRYLKRKLERERFDTASASESVLGSDWNRPEEDAAWSDL